MTKGLVDRVPIYRAHHPPRMVGLFFCLNTQMKYRSKFEQEFHRLQPAAQYEAQKIKFTQPAKQRTYIADWVLDNGVICETKGYLDLATRQKMLWLRDSNPDLDIRFVFQNPDNRISKTSKTRYRDWAEANGFQWCRGPSIPEEWTK